MNSRTCRAFSFFVLLGVSPIHGQPQNATFEAASVKPNVSRTGIRGHAFPGDRFEATNVPLRDLIMVAYGEPGQLLPESYISGPAWIDADRFDVSATVESGSVNTVARKQLLLRTLLEDRFRFHAIFESKVVSAFELRQTRADRALGPRLHTAAVDCEALLATQPGRGDRCVMSLLPTGTLTLRGQTMNAFANALASLLEKPVLDRTDLAGGFDADAEFDPTSVPGMSQLAGGTRPKDLPSLDTALREALGLRLQSTRASVKTLVVDHVERPTPD